MKIYQSEIVYRKCIEEILKRIKQVGDTDKHVRMLFNIIHYGVSYSDDQMKFLDTIVQ